MSPVPSVNKVVKGRCGLFVVTNCMLRDPNMGGMLGSDTGCHLNPKGYSSVFVFCECFPNQALPLGFLLSFNELFVINPDLFWVVAAIIRGTKGESTKSGEEWIG